MSPSSVLLSWKVHNPTNQIIQHITVQATSTNDNQRLMQSTLSATSTSFIVTKLKPGIKYRLIIQAITVNTHQSLDIQILLYFNFAGIEQTWCSDNAFYYQIKKKNFSNFTVV